MGFLLIVLIAAFYLFNNEELIEGYFTRARLAIAGFNLFGERESLVPEDIKIDMSDIYIESLLKEENLIRPNVTPLKGPLPVSGIPANIPLTLTDMPRRNCPRLSKTAFRK